MKKFLVGFLLASLVFGGTALVAGNITSTGIYQKDLYTFLSNVVTFVNGIKSQTNTANLVSGGLATGANATCYKTANAISYMIAGKLYNKAATDNIAATACTAQSASKYRLYLISIDSAGTCTVTAGTETSTDTAVLPAQTASKVPIGAIKVQTGAGGTFTMGTSSLAVADNVAAVTYYNFLGQTYTSTTDLTLSDL